MAFLTNRVAPARFMCLHALCQLINANFSTASKFTMNEIKYNPPLSDIREYCKLLQYNANLKIKFCPYKRSSLDASGCFLTNGLVHDTTKSKEVSNTVNALYALGLILRDNDNDLCLTNEGKKFAETEFDTPEMLEIIRQSILNYGLMVGFLGRLFLAKTTSFKTTDYHIGYPDTNEVVLVGGESVRISSGSQQDSCTRSKSCILAWAMAAGYIWPTELLSKYDPQKPHITSLDYINGRSRNLQNYTIMEPPSSIIGSKFITAKPLDYNNLTKNIGALRENNQKNTRETTLLYEPKIKNRRLAILLSLHKAFVNSSPLDPEALVKYLAQYPEKFIIDKSSFKNIMYKELDIAFSAGIPYRVTNNKLVPLTDLNIDELTKNAPADVLSIIS